MINGMKSSMGLKKPLRHIRSYSLEASGHSGLSWADMEEDPEPARTTASTKFQEKQLKRTSWRGVSSSRLQEDRQKTSDQAFLAKPVTNDEEDDKYWEAEEDLEITRNLRKEERHEPKILVSKFISRCTPLSQLVMMKSTLRNAKRDYIYSESCDHIYSESCGYYPEWWLYDAVEQERRISMHIFDVAKSDPFTFLKAHT